MIEADVIEPWDPYIPDDVVADLIPAIRDECTIDGKLYGWPFLLDVIGMGWHSGITAEAGIIGAPPATWTSISPTPRRWWTAALRHSARPSTPTAGARWRP